MLLSKFSATPLPLSTTWMVLRPCWAKHTSERTDVGDTSIEAVLDVLAGASFAGVGYPLCWVCGSVASAAHDGLSRPWEPR